MFNAGDEWDGDEAMEAHCVTEVTSHGIEASWPQPRPVWHA